MSCNTKLWRSHSDFARPTGNMPRLVDCAWGTEYPSFRSPFQWWESCDKDRIGRLEIGPRKLLWMYCTISINSSPWPDFQKIRASDHWSGAKSGVKPYFLTPLWRVTDELIEIVQYCVIAQESIYVPYTRCLIQPKVIELQKWLECDWTSTHHLALNGPLL